MQYTAIITTCQRPHALGRALRSVFQQTLGPAEILVVDDGGDISAVQTTIAAGTERALGEDPTKRMAAIEALPNRGYGISAARNTGIRRARSAWVVFLDDDDEWQPMKAHRQAAIVQATRGRRLCHADEIWLRAGRRVNQSAQHKKAGGAIYERCLKLCCISPSAVFAHLSLFEDHGLFDESLAVCEDYDMWLRICAYEEIAYVPEPLVIKHGGHADQLSRRYWGMDRFRVRALMKMMDDPKLDAAKRDATRAMLIQKLTILAKGAARRANRRRHLYYTDLLARYAANVPT